MNIGDDEKLFDFCGDRIQAVKFPYTPEGGDMVEWYGLRSKSAVAIVPFHSDGTIVMVHQPRPVVGKMSLEIPAGILEPGEDPFECAKRELREETGYTAKTWANMGYIHTSPGILDERMYLFAAKNLIAGQQDLDPDERITVRHMTADDIQQAIREGLILDSKTMAAIFLSHMPEIAKSPDSADSAE